MSTVAALLLAREDDNRLGFLHEDGRWTYRQVIDEGRRRAARFQELHDPDRPPHIGVLLDNTPTTSSGSSAPRSPARSSSGSTPPTTASRSRS